MEYIDIIDNSKPCNTIITRKWIVRDNCGNSDSCSQIIIVKDTILPTLNNIPEDITVACMDDVPAPPAVFVTDNCGVYLPIVSDSISDFICDNSLTITRTWTAADDCGNTVSASQVITVKDTIKPIISCPPELLVPIGDEVPNPYATIQEFIAAGGNVSDDCGNSAQISIAVQFENRITGNLVDTLIVTYEFSDECGNTATCEQVIIIETDPGTEITCPGNVTSACYGEAPIPYQTLDEFITEGGSVTSKCSIDSSSFALVGQISDGNKCPEIIDRYYQISDECGNSVTCIQTIIINDTIPPEISCPPGFTIEVGETIHAKYSNYAEFVSEGGSASDNCGLDFSSFHILEQFISSNIAADTLTRIYEIADSCGNTSICEQAIIIQNDLNLNFDCPGETEILVGCIDDIPEPHSNFSSFINSGGSASSDCGIIEETFTVLNEVSDNNKCPEKIIRTYEVQDSCGNLITCSTVFVVYDNTAPTLTCLPDTTIEVGGSIPAIIADYDAFVIAGGSASDDCGIIEESFNWVSDVSDENEFPETITRTYEIYDSCDNRAVCEQLIIVEGDAQLSVTCPSELSFTCIDEVIPPYNSYSEYFDAGGSAYSICGIDTSSFFLLSDITDGEICPTTIKRNYAILDSCGHLIICNHIITVNDDIAPELECPPDKTILPGESYNPYTNYNDFVDAGGIAEDNCGLLEKTFHIDFETYLGNDPQLITRTYSITDSCSNAASCLQQLTVYKTSDLQLICPSTVVIDCGLESIPAYYDNYEQFVKAGGIAIGSPPIDESTFKFEGEETDAKTCPETITRIYSIKNIAGDSITCEQLIVINDITSPVFNMRDKFVNCKTIPPKYTTVEMWLQNGGTLSDECSIDESSFTIISEYSDNRSCPETIIRVYEIADDCGNRTRAREYIIVDDKLAPRVTRAPNEIEVSECGTTPPYETLEAFREAGGVVEDLCGTITMQFMGDAPIGDGCPRLINRTYRFTDNCGNYTDYIQRYTINDTIAPKIIQVPNDTTTICARSTLNSYSDFVKYGGIVEDNCEIDTSSFILTKQEDSGDLICPKVYTNTYRIYDYCGNYVSFTHEVLVTDTEPPILICPQDTAIEANSSVPEAFQNYNEFSKAGGKASDNCAINAASFRLVSMETAQTTCGETYIFTYEISDFCGNTATCVHTVGIGDVIPPVMQCPTSITVTCEKEAPPIFRSFEDFIAAGGNAYDDEDLNVLSFEFVEENYSDTICPRDIIRTYQITDQCDNVSTCEHIIRVTDNVPPEISCPPTVTAECISDAPPEYQTITEFINAGGSVSDNCSIDSSSFRMLYAESVQSNQGNEFLRWYAVQDNCGNISFCSQSIRLTDIIPPVAVCNEISVYLDENGKAVITDIELTEIASGSSDNCTPLGSLNLNTNRTEFDCTQLGTAQQINIFVTDEASNTSQCTASIIIEDTIPPVTSCTDTMVYLDENGNANLNVSMINNQSFDNCGFDTIYVSPSTLDCSATGDNFVTLTVVDKYSNISECTAKVTVKDTIPPRVICQDITVQLDLEASYSLEADEIILDAFDECGIDSMSLNQFDFSCDDIGNIFVTVTVADFNNNTSACTAAVEVVGNVAPIAENDTAYTVQNTSIAVNVANNDYDTKTNVLSSSVRTLFSPANGVAEVNPVTGYITYTPNPGFKGTDVVAYSICDDGIPCMPMCAQALLVIHVLAPNEAPVAEDDNFRLLCHTLEGDVTNNDYDPDSHILVVDTTPVVHVNHGTLILNPSGTFIYQPDENFLGIDSFTYRLCEIGIPALCDTATAYIEILPDNDCDGITDWEDIDDDNDGILDIVEGDQTTDTDGDGIFDSFDIDSDNDGIPDNIEGQGETTYIPPTGVDSDNDGWDNAYDPDNGGTQFIPVDTDGDETPDYLDIDTDDDGVFDYIEGHDIDADGIPDESRFYTDSDQDGLDDAYDIYDDQLIPSTPYNETGSNAPLQDFDGDGKRDWRDTNDDEDEFLTYDEDWNGDGDFSNDDMDLDGHPDYLDVETDCSLFIPDAFSPNGDGVHDFFQIFCIQRYPEAKLMIFSRSGNKLFEKEHYGNLEYWGSDETAWWWGTSEAKLTLGGGTLPAGTYVYILELGNGDVKTGTVFLNR
uniref:HYR-like domain-containing protein n=1 Tax=Maribellus maritimus TaxID=2870838 RepID=UPI001EEA0F2F|nr:Ig-like domain-containing protein [Maribellus maritimus]